MIVVLAVCKTRNLTSMNKGGSQEPPFFHYGLAEAFAEPTTCF